MKRGFTLVELSIVLVIVGLLIGGILAAQSMVGTAKIQSVTREIQQYDIAVSNFQTQYNSLPGDSKLLTPAGNGDGSLFTTTATTHNCDSNWSNLLEVKSFWIQLSQAGFNPKNFTYTSTVSGTGLSSDPSAANVPALSFSKTAQIIAVDGPCPNYTNPFRPSNTYTGVINHWVILDLTSIQYIGNAVHPVFTPAEALAIDQKMDDGKPALGKVQGLMDSGVAGLPNPAHCVKLFNDSNTDYYLSSKKLECEMSINMLSQVGQN